MSRIQSITEPWNGHTHAEVEDFIKQSLEKGGGGTTVTSVTWAELKSRRDSSRLTPGGIYLLTDYVATTTQDNTRSAGHAFDLILFAEDVDVLSEDCLARRHEGDDYFAKANLAAWRVSYCLDNDKSRFLWADLENGKGVIYRLIDEWNNDIPFDFKSIQFKRLKVSGEYVEDAYEDTDVRYLGIPDAIPSVFEVEDEDDFIWAYVFNGIDDEEDYSTTRDVTVKGFLSGDEYDPDGGYPFSVLPSDVQMKPYRVIVADDNGDPQTVASLNNIVFEQLYYQTLSYDVHGCTFEAGCYNMTFGSKDSYGNSFGVDCHDNTFGNSCNNNTFGNGCYRNTFGNYCQYNQFGNYCHDNTFGNEFYQNTFGNDCSYNQFGNNCSYNQFGNNCYYNQFGNGLQNNQFGNGCENNTFGNNVRNGTVGQGVNNISVTPSGSTVVQYFHILNGTHGSGSNKLSISFIAGTSYAQFAGLDSSGDLQVWTPADNA